MNPRNPLPFTQTGLFTDVYGLKQGHERWGAETNVSKVARPTLDDHFTPDPLNGQIESGEACLSGRGSSEHQCDPVVPLRGPAGSAAR